jgi:hypothetical protein
MSDGRQQTSPSYELIGNAGAHARTLYLFLALVVVMIVMSYYVLFKYFLKGDGAQMSDGHPFDDDHGVDDQFNNPEFYRRLRQGALEKS